MPLTIEDVVTHFVFSSHPRNRAIVDIKNKKTGDMKFIKIRHRLDSLYAVSLVDPVSFEVLAEIQVKSATARTKPIILHSEDKEKGNKVELTGSSRIGFEYSFEWEGQKYRWVRESRMSNVLECRAIRKTGDICIAQYLPRILKDEYFGIFSILGYNILRCELAQTKELELILFMSLMTLLDKSDDGGWKRDPIGKGVRDDGKYKTGSSTVLPTVQPEDSTPKKEQLKKIKAKRENEQRLNFMIEKGVRKSQKQIQHENDIIDKKKSTSAGNSPSTTPNVSPLPTPSVSTNNSNTLRRQKSASHIECSSDDLLNSGKLARLFSNLGHPKQDESITSPIISANNNSSSTRKSIVNNDSLTYTPIRSQHYNNNNNNNNYYYYNQLSFPYGQYNNIASEYGLQKYQPQSSHPPSLRSIQWNAEPKPPVQSSSSHVPLPTTRRPRITDAQRRQSASEYNLYYQQYQPGYDYTPRSNTFNNRYSASEYYYDNSAYYHQ